ncbi:hypothetical protein HPG69_014405 [Diceros bicornis minor]|uniref:Protein 4.1 n=1 Tax=Diceros bicornis minor TaxID=77932 RepID=A0A7J7EW95_DICBM|nr:hypothetical protein HPG69_014405 [Diceros bicornis minor]
MMGGSIVKKRISLELRGGRHPESARSKWPKNDTKSEFGWLVHGNLSFIPLGLGSSIDSLDAVQKLLDNLYKGLVLHMRMKMLKGWDTGLFLGVTEDGVASVIFLLEQRVWHQLSLIQFFLLQMKCHNTFDPPLPLPQPLPRLGWRLNDVFSHSCALVIAGHVWVSCCVGQQLPGMGAECQALSKGRIRHSIGGTVRRSTAPHINGLCSWDTSNRKRDQALLAFYSENWLDPAKEIKRQLRTHTHLMRSLGLGCSQSRLAPSSISHLFSLWTSEGTSCPARTCFSPSSLFVAQRGEGGEYLASRDSVVKTNLISELLRGGLPWLFTFNVKFYPPDPSQLTEDITRYFLCLQLRQDIASGRLPCSFVTHALLGSYTLQAELGDYDPKEHGSNDLSDFQFAPTQTKELEEKVAELHKTHRGLSPAQADSQFLENAKRLSMYGVDLHHAKDSEGVDIKLGVCANGLLIYKDRLRINRFAWPKILKISYKRSNFYIKVRPAELEQFESTIGFKLPNHRAAKRLWKVCVEHHTFYRLVSPEQPPKATFLTVGSRFRYSGRTHAQSRQASALIGRPAPRFERASSKRASRSLDGAPIGDVDQSLMKDFPGPAREVLAYGPGVASTAVVPDGDGRRDIRSPAKAPHVQLIEGKDLDKAQEDILRHQASISELKRNFMESTPEPRPNEWEKRRITPLSLQTQGRKGDHLFKDVLSVKEKHQMAATRTVEETAQEADKSLEEEITSILFSDKGFSGSMRAFTSATTRTAEGAVVNCNAPSEKLSSSPFSQLPESSHETLTVVEEKQQAEVGKDKDERVIPEEVNGKESSPGSGPGERRQVEPLTREDSTSLSSESSGGSESEEEDAGEYRPRRRLPEGAIREEQEECAEEAEREAGRAAEGAEREAPAPAARPGPAGPSVGPVDAVARERVVAPDVPAETSATEGALEPAVSGEAEDQHHTVNGEVSHVDIDVLPQIICCSENLFFPSFPPQPPVVKTEMVTISDASQRTEISTKEVPIVQTETKTITYESPQIDGGAGGDSGTLLTAQTITSESVSTTTTTHITKTVKGGISETRIEKRIVITGDADIDHDQALAQAIREAREQHPDMSVTRVVVHKETELEEGED